MLKFGLFELDGNTVRLTKNNDPVDLEPLAFNMLLLLVENRNRVITKQELLDKIWKGRPVTDYVITRIIYKLRKTIDINDNSDSLIRTVRGKGYQFIGAVTESVKPENSERNANFNWKYPVVLLTIVLALLIFQFLPDQFEKKDSSTLYKKEARIGYPVIVVMPIEIIDENEELSMLTQTLIDYLTNQLSINLNMKVIHPDSLINLNHKDNDIWSVQQMTNADYVIQGFLESASNKSVRIHLNLYNKSNDDLIPYDLGGFGFPYPESTKDLNDLYKQQKVTVKNIIRIIEPGLEIRDNSETETQDPEAYRMVIAAHHLSRTDACNNFPRAEKLLLQAVERDDQFVYAYHLLFSNYFKRVWLCGESTDYHKKSLEMAKIVEELAPNSHQSLEIGRNTILVESNQVEKAFTYTQNADINNASALYRKVYGLRYAGFLNLASDHIDRILQLDPFFFSQKPIQQAPHTLLYQGRYEEYLALLAEPGNAYHDYYRGLTYTLLGRNKEAKVILNSVVKSMPNDMFGRFALAILQIIDGKKDQALKTAQAIVDLRAEKKHTDGEMSYKIVQLFALAGDTDTALWHLQKTVEQGFFPFYYFSIDPALEMVRLKSEFVDVMNKSIKRHKTFAKKFTLSAENEKM